MNSLRADGAAGASIAERIGRLRPEQRHALARTLGASAAARLRYEWRLWARPSQREPDGLWQTWLVLAGRGFGKTRTGAEWVRACAARDPMARIALVGASEAEVRAVMVEGDSGILAVCPPAERPLWEPALKRLRWPGGARAYVYSAAQPEGLRGPQHHFAWCDEAAKWSFGQTAWDNLMLGLRCGDLPRVVVTTTPKPVQLLRTLLKQPRLAVTGGPTAENAFHLPAAYVERMHSLYGGTRLGRQELDGELIEDVEGSLWPRGLIEASRQGGTLPREALRRVVIGVDPPATAGGDACGIVVCGLGADGVGYVLADATVAGLRPEGWARAVVHAAETWEADRVVVETNQGGEMVESVLRGVDCHLPVRPARAHKKKAVRAEPVAALFERGKAKFAGCFPALEDELSGMTIAGGYEGPGRSPDRADAMVWAMGELMLAKPRQLRITVF